jgi:hypothetical protein
MAHFSLISTLFCLVIETKLKGIVPVYLFGSDLGNYARSSLYDGARNVFPVIVKNAGHAYFFSY